MNAKGNTKRISFEDAKAICEGKNLIVLDKFLFINSDQKLRLQCSVCDEIRVGSIAEIKERVPCIKCLRLRQRLTSMKWTLDDVKKECAKKNIACLSEVYVKNKAPMKFKCLDSTCKNEWETSFAKLKRLKYGCCKCGYKIAGELKKGQKNIRRKWDIDLARSIAYSKGLNLLSEYFANVFDDLDFECLKCKTKITKSLAYVQQTKKNCPDCRLKTTSYGLNLGELLVLCGKKSTFEFIDNRKALRKPYKIKCRVCKTISLDDLKYIKRNKCRNCLAKIVTDDKKITLLKKLEPLTLKNSKLISKALHNSKAEFLCTKCDKVYSKSLSDDSNRIRCPKCYPKLGFARDKDEINVLLKNTIFECISDIRRKKGKVEFKCKKCNKAFESYYTQVAKRKNCPLCDELSRTKI